MNGHDSCIVEELMLGIYFFVLVFPNSLLALLKILGEQVSTVMPRLVQECMGKFRHAYFVILDADIASVYDAMPHPFPEPIRNPS